MNWADFGLGTWHPKNGMYRIVEGIVSIATSLGVKFHTEAAVDKIQVNETGKSRRDCC
jgi:phytoene desaturase